MTPRTYSYPHFRLNLEQQRKRAKELLAAARAGDPAALARLIDTGAIASPTAELRLAAAQFTIARELRFESWARLKAHITAMTREREQLAASAGPEAAEADSAGPGSGPGFAGADLARPGSALALDADRRTLHIRCGSDIERTLREAGFRGDFLEHSYPYLIGPVREGPGALEQRARFLVASYDSDERPLVHADVLASLEQGEQALLDSADYERVVIWSEHDCYDQLVELRLLGHYAAHRRPPALELVNLGEFPGSTRFIGLGQLPPEALRLLWRTRKRVGKRELELGLDAWRALASPDPRTLADIARSGTPALPLLAPALRRHLSELPSLEDGLSFTQRLALELIAAGPASLGRIFAELNARLDPLPGQGDLQVRDRVLAMEQVREPLIVRSPGVDGSGASRPPWTDRLAITAAGRAALAGTVDYMSLDPPARWVGGAEIGAGQPDWRWESRASAVVLR